MRIYIGVTGAGGEGGGASELRRVVHENVCWGDRRRTMAVSITAAYFSIVSIVSS